MGEVLEALFAFVIALVIVLYHERSRLREYVTHNNCICTTWET